MGQNVILRDPNTGDPIYPMTTLDNIYDSEGNTIEAKIQDALEDFSGYTPVEIVTETSGSFTLNPNTFYTFGTMSSLTIALASPTNGILNEYMFEFDSGSTATTLTLPSGILWNITPSIVAYKHYEISIRYNQKYSIYYGVISNWATS